ITTPAEFNDQDKLIAWELLDVAAERGGADTGAVAWRYSYSGNPRDSGASIAHLHGHVVSAMEGARVPINVGRVQPD
ncbi:MAG: hypothetical protein AAB834_07500, partial [Patescibacteria group bacterium]